MKFVLPTFSSSAYTLVTFITLSFSVPMVTPVLATDNSDACESMKPASLDTVQDLLSMGYYQQECKKDLLAAVSSFTKAINLNPKAEDAYYSRANAYQQLEDYFAALADYTIVIKLSTDRLDLIRDSYWHRARVYNKLDEKQKAISDLTQLITKYNGNAGDYLLRAKLYKDLGNNDGADADYKSTDKILQRELSRVFGNSYTGANSQDILDKLRNDLSKTDVLVSASQPATSLILQSIVKTEVERALDLARYTNQHPVIQLFGTQIQDLHEQLANIQSQPYKGTLNNLIANAAYTKIDGIEKERAELIKMYTLDHPVIKLIDTQAQELKILIDRNK